MGKERSFTNYIAERFDNDFWKVAEDYLENNSSTLNINYNHIHKIGDYEIQNVKVEHIWVEDKQNMDIEFDAAVSINVIINDGDHHYDNYDETIKWIMVHCSGNLDNHLDDFEILEVSEYNGKNRVKDALDDSLVPYISSDKLENVAEEFLKKYYPEVLKVPQSGICPEWLDPSSLALRMGLNIIPKTIKKDSSVFGQIYFEDTIAKMYDKNTNTEVETKIPGKTIVVDPNIHLFRNLGSVNNTIVHECVHWEKHRKAFKLEQLYNESLSCISCQVVGGIETQISRQSTEFMERQANQLAPRIQMPKTPFSIKAKEYIAKFMRELNASHEIDVMERVIDQLATDFVVSRQSAKIRLVELGFSNAIGTFNYIDGQYVKAHSFKKDSIKINQTFTISAVDAAIQRAANMELRQKTQNGDYLFIENHYVFNSPLYVGKNDDGSLALTDYARAHMNECCLAFDLKITSKIENEYFTICYLNRENTDVTFEVTYHNGYENSPQSKQIELRKKQMEEYIEIQKQMTGDPEQCIKLLLKWRDMDYTTLGAEIDIDPKTISRNVNGQTTPKLGTAALICFGLNLPPMLSDRFLDVLGCKLSATKIEHQWIREALNVKYPEPIWKIQEFLNNMGIDLKKV